jgi:hypothetical protein
MFRHGEAIVALDVYGALSLIANERTGTPICGLDVELTDNQVILRRGDGALPETGIQLAPNEFFGDFSTAQGGRRISAWVTDATFVDVLREYTFVNGIWVRTHERPLGGRQRVYVESDTIYVPFDGQTEYERRSADGSVGVLDLFNSGAFAGYTSTPLVSAVTPLPDGRWMFMRVIGPAACANGEYEPRVMLLSLKPAVGPPVMLRDVCSPPEPAAPGLGVWSTDASRLFGFGAAGRTLWLSTTLSGGWQEGPTAPLGDRQTFISVAAPDDAGTFGIELASASCDRVLRSQQIPTVFVTIAAGSASTCPPFRYPFLRSDGATTATKDAELRAEYEGARRRRPMPSPRVRRTN